jgi:hypothetical protein
MSFYPIKLILNGLMVKVYNLLLLKRQKKVWPRIIFQKVCKAHLSSNSFRVWLINFWPLIRFILVNLDTRFETASGQIQSDTRIPKEKLQKNSGRIKGPFFLDFLNNLQSEQFYGRRQANILKSKGKGNKKRAGITSPFYCFIDSVALSYLVWFWL